jgi:cystathionine beta-lyase
MRQETKCVRSGGLPDELTGGVNTPIYTSSAFEYVERDCVTYPRYFNTPNQHAVVQKICALEGAEDGVLFSSGMAAMSTSILAFAGSGDHVLMMDELYGGTHAFATDQFERLGIAFDFAATDADDIASKIRDTTKVIVIESPTNPLLNVIDIRRVAEIASARGILTIIDNTFATPINQNPLQLGVDVVVHSGTKYLGGHSDICCGIAVSNADRAASIRALARHLGGSLNATTCYLLERSLKTLAVRVERQTRNGQQIAEFLESQDSVRRVFYPGLPSSPGFDVARSQMQGFGAMVAMEVEPSVVAAQTVLERLQLIRAAVSLGGIESTICCPVDTSHAKMSRQERERIGITDSLLRLSVGIEHIDDLVDDLSHALSS